MYTWEEEFVSDDSNLYLDGKEIGKVSPVGASWQVFYGAELIAFRPDKTSAQNRLVKYHQAIRKENDGK